MGWLEQMVAQYGYLAIFAGTFLEGETILILGGLAAQQGLLELPWVMATAGLGSLLGDQLAFFIGWRWGGPILARFPAWQARVARIQAKAARFLDLWMLSFRFFYGLRNLTPFVLASSRVSPYRFGSLNALGAAIWAVAGAWGGYALGYALERYLQEVKTYLLWGLGGLLALAALFRLGRALYLRSRRPAPAANPDAPL